jgi:Pvc16 N-terminal domain
LLHLLDESLEAFLRAETPLPAAEIDVSFEAPDRTWSAGITKPTVNMFLSDVRRCGDETRAGAEVVERDGIAMRRQPLPKVELQYLVTAWTTDVRDEHHLLGSMLAALFKNPELPAAHARGPFAATEPRPTLRVASADAESRAEFWSAIDGQLKPGLQVIVTAPIDAALMAPAGPPTKAVEIETVDGRDARRRSRRHRVGGKASEPGAMVRSPRGVAWVDEKGRFLVPAEPGDPVIVEGESPPKPSRRARPDDIVVE